MSLTNLTHITRSEGDPRVERKGQSSMIGADRLARALGWFSVGLGVAELVAPGRIARTLGLDDKQGLIRAYGAREVASAVPTLSIDKPIGLASRIAGDALDLGTLATGLQRDNPQRRNAAIATARELPCSTSPPSSASKLHTSVNRQADATIRIAADCRAA